jgi:RNA polymerase sigma-70 factor, ECF subfamily
LNHAAEEAVETAARDRELMNAILGGSRDAVATLYDRHAPRMLGLAARILRDRVDAEDLVHDVFLEAWTRASAYDPGRASVQSWLLMRTRCRALDRARALAVARRHALRMRAPEHNLAGTNVEHLCPKGALEALSVEQRQMVQLAYYSGLSCREIADQCGIPVGTVKSRLFAAMLKLRERMRREQGAGRSIALG